MNWQLTLKKLIDHPEIHGRFLNTLSLMEYIGARKIVKSQRESQIDSEVLAHMTEEIRHAQIFKKLALQISDGRLRTYDEEYLAAGAEGRSYLQTIDRGIESLLGHGRFWENYLLSTLVIEERANQVYPEYARLLAPFGMDGYLKTILREEAKHLNEIREQLGGLNGLNQDQLAAIKQLEQQAFDAIIARLDFCLQTSSDDIGLVGPH